MRLGSFIIIHLEYHTAIKVPCECRTVLCPSVARPRSAACGAAAGCSDYDTLLQNYADTLTQLFSFDFAAQPFTQYSDVLVLTSHVATEAEPILSHLFGAEFGLEILLETGRLSSQLFSDWSVLCCSRTKLGSKNCHTIFGAEFGAAAPLLSQRAHTAHAFESQKPPL